jgi:Rieske Fe-S protein
MSSEKDIVLEVNADELLSAWSQWGKVYENFSYTGNGSMRLSANTSDLVKIFVGGGAGDNAKTTISLIMDTSAPGIIVETDTTAPEITLLSPEAGAIYATREIILEVKADEPVSNWSYRLNGGEIIAVESVNGSVKLTLTADEGTNTVEIYAVDGVGNTGMSVVSFSVDATPPNITVLSPEKGKIYATREIILEVEADEPVSNWSYRLNGGEIIAVESVNGSVNVTLTADEGTNTVEIYAVDGVGNTGMSVVSFSVDTTPPNIAVLSPETGKTYATNALTLELKADEPISYWSYRLNGKERKQITTGCSTNGSVSVMLSAEEGANKVEIYAEDSVGNVGVEAVMLNVDTTPPQITVLSPVNLQIFTTKEIMLELKADEPIYNWSYRLNGEELMTFTVESSANERVTIPLIAKFDTNIVKIYAEDSVGNTGTTIVSFIVVNPCISSELSLEGVGYFRTDKELTSENHAIVAKDEIVGLTGPEGAYKIDLLEILSDAVSLTDPLTPNYHQSTSLSFSGNALDSYELYSSSVSQEGISTMLTEKDDVTELQKESVVSIKTNLGGGKESFNTNTSAAFSGMRETKIERTTPTEEILLNQMLDGNCTAQMKLSFG